MIVDKRGHIKRHGVCRLTQHYWPMEKERRYR